MAHRVDARRLEKRFIIRHDSEGDGRELVLIPRIAGAFEHRHGGLGGHLLHEASLSLSVEVRTCNQRSGEKDEVPK